MAWISGVEMPRLLGLLYTLTLATTIKLKYRLRRREWPVTPALVYRGEGRIHA